MMKFTVLQLYTVLIYTDLYSLTKYLKFIIQMKKKSI